MAIKAAAKNLQADIRVTFLVVQKRNHTRFFPPRGDGDRNNNVYAGTVVNRQIMHPVEHDFFLVSHQSIRVSMNVSFHWHMHFPQILQIRRIFANREQRDQPSTTYFITKSESMMINWKR